MVPKRIVSIYPSNLYDGIFLYAKAVTIDTQIIPYHQIFSFHFLSLLGFRRANVYYALYATFHSQGRHTDETYLY